MIIIYLYEITFYMEKNNKSIYFILIINHNLDYSKIEIKNIKNIFCH